MSRCTSRSLPHLHRTVAPSSARREGRRGAEPVDAGVGARGDCRRRRLRAGDVGQPGLRRAALHPAQPRQDRARARAADARGHVGAPIEIDGGIDLSQRRGRRRGRRDILVAGQRHLRHAAIPKRATRALRAAACGRRPAMSAASAPVALARPGARPLRRNRPDGRRLLRQLPGVVRGRPHRLAARAGLDLPRHGGRRASLPVIEAHCEYQQAARIRR